LFERRLKIFLTAIIALAVVMVLRAVQLQMFQRDRWKSRADEAMRRWTLVDTPRGKIFDRRGKLLASDDPCIDAAVDYRACMLEPDPDWLKAQALKRLPGKSEIAASGIPREQLLAAEIERVKADIDQMWIELAKVSGKSMEEIQETRNEILRKVMLLQRNALYKRFVRSSGKEGSGSSGWLRWLVDAKSSDPEQQHDADLAAIQVVVGEQLQSHVMLAGIDNDAQIYLRKKMSRCPGLELKESTHRKYEPQWAQTASHILGSLSPVEEKDVKSEVNAQLDALRKYWPRDLKGHGGVEGLAEPILRGSKGQLVRLLGNKAPVEAVKPISGGNALCSIDVELQAQVLESFKTLVTHDNQKHEEIIHELHGAAVVIDVPTNEVLVMASYPTYDLNRYESDYLKYRLDVVNAPLRNRATMAQHEPGSTVKTIIGSVAITEGVIRHDQGIECTGYFVYPDRLTGKPIRIAGTNRCWIASLYAEKGYDVSHHQLPFEDPHKGDYGNPPGFLTVSDAIQRSCNVFFQTVADRMHLRGVTDALSRFGLGKSTGIGIPEATGRVPRPEPGTDGQFESDNDRRSGWLAGIGQGQVAATPLQMANVAATLARNGVWMRPRLLTGDSAKAIYDRMPNTTHNLNLSQLALRAVRDGMIRVTRTPAGSGQELWFNDLRVAGKTGSAQVGELSVEILDERGQPARAIGADGKENTGRPLRRTYPPGTKEKPSELGWYYQTVSPNSTHLAHAWFIGYAPAEDPKIAFCVFVEYGGSGGQVAGALARDIVAACAERGYVPPTGGLHLR
jgi:penicillin-binding protein 2